MSFEIISMKNAKKSVVIIRKTIIIKAVIIIKIIK